MDVPTRLRRSGLFRAAVMLMVLLALAVLVLASRNTGRRPGVKLRRRLSSKEKFEQSLQRHKDFLGEADRVLGSRGNRRNSSLPGHGGRAGDAMAVNRGIKTGAGMNPGEKKCINIVMILTNVRGGREAAARTCLVSLLRRSAARLCFHFIIDEYGKTFAETLVSTRPLLTSAVYYDSQATAVKLAPYIDSLRSRFSTGDRNYFNNPVFFLAPVLYSILPTTVERVIFLDSDLKFRADVAELYAEFDRFKAGQVVGMAYENQPVYKHLLAAYISAHPKSWIARDHPDGIIGYNSGVMLQDLAAIRKDNAYRSLLEGESVKQLSEKYQFKGHLGAQDLFTLISLEHKEFFHRLPCQWNRQLCRFWQRGYQAIFEKYYQCPGPIKVYHGNCHSPIPSVDA